MKKLSLVMFGVALASMILLSGCAATVMTSPTVGALYTSTSSPSFGPTETKDISQMKKGIADCKSVLGIAAWGDCSTEAAARNGGIKKIHHVDHNTFVIVLGIYNKYTTAVYGE